MGRLGAVGMFMLVMRMAAGMAMPVTMIMRVGMAVLVIHPLAGARIGGRHQ